MSVANLVYMPKIHHRRFARNGMIPDAKFANGLIQHLNHSVAYRRKTVWTFGDWDTDPGSSTPHRFWFHSGYAVDRLALRLGIWNKGTEFPSDPTVAISVKISGGATTTETIHLGFPALATLSPDAVAWYRPEITITENTDYEVSIAVTDGARVVSGCAFERTTNVLSQEGEYISDSPSLFYPIYDSLRQELLENYSNVWLRNGSHLLTWSMNATTAPTFTSTTWTNVIDAATSVSASTAGFYLGDSGYDLTQHCRIKDGTTLDVVLACYGNCTGGSTGEVRLQNSSGTIVSKTGITSTAQWHTTTTTIGSVELITKADLQARVAAGGSTLNLHAVCLLTYAS